jgi:hypothetical protein
LQLVLVFCLQLDQIRNLRAARPAPRRPEIEQHDLATGIGKSERLAVERRELELRRRIGIAHQANHVPALLRVCRGAAGDEQKRKKQRGNEVKK